MPYGVATVDAGAVGWDSTGHIVDTVVPPNVAVYTWGNQAPLGTPLAMAKRALGYGDDDDDTWACGGFHSHVICDSAAIRAAMSCSD